MKRLAYPFILALFFLSGITGLVYEVVWTRMLTLVFGHTVHAVSTVLASFMGGLALGSWMFAKRADRQRFPLRLYAALELGIGVFALVVPLGFDRLDGVLGPIYRGIGDHFAFFSSVRFVLSFAILLVPTVLMGATLPVLAHAVASGRSEFGGRIGRLYAMNTLGAVAGCFLAGFVLLEALGVLGSIRAAAIVNLTIAALAWLFSGAFEVSSGAETRGESGALPSEPEREEMARPWLLPVLYGVSGFVALALEVAWTRALIFSFFMGSSTYAFATMLTIFLLGLGLGSLAGASLADRLARRVRALAWGEVLIGAAALASGPALVWLSGLHLRESAQSTWFVGTVRDVLKAATVMFAPTFAMGALFPLFARVFIRSVEGAGRGVGRLYFANTAGAILGSIGAGFVLVPVIGVGRSILLLGAVSLALGVVLIVVDLRSGWGERLAVFSSALLILGAFVVVYPSGVPFQRVGSGEKLLMYREGSAGTVAVVETPSGERRLQIDNVWIAGTNPVMTTAHKTLAHIGALLQPDPKRVLTVGFASGGTSWSYTMHPELEAIDCVEIADTVLDARQFFTSVNGTVLDDPRYRVILEDARTFLLLGEGQYDIVSTDCTDLRYKSDANLYTEEYFELCKRRLTRDGMLVVFLPFGGLTEPIFKGVLATFQRVFPEGTVWYLHNYPTHYFLLIGSVRPLRVQWDSFVDRMKIPAVAKDLASIGLDDPYRILGSFLMGPRELARFVEGSRINSVYDPWVEFEAPRTHAPGVLDNLDLLVDASLPSPPPVDGMNDAERASLDRSVKAARHVLRGHVHASRGEVDQARLEYEDSLAIVPGDALLERYLGMSADAAAELEARIRSNPDDMQARADLSMIVRRRGDASRAEALLREVLSREPSRFPAAMSLAVTLEAQGRLEEAAAQYDAAARLAGQPQEKDVARSGREIVDRRITLRERPDDVQGALDLAQLYVRYQDLHEAIRFLERRAAERREPQVLEGLTSLCLQARMVDRAEKSARRLLELAPGSGAAHYYLMDIQFRRGRLDEAEQEFDASRAVDDKNPALWLGAARLFRLRGREADCTDALRKTLLFGGPEYLQIARQDPVLSGSASLAEVSRSYAGPVGGRAR